MTKLSVIIIAKNEEGNLRDCLESVAWVDEIVVVDSGSTDSTVAIAHEFTEQVYVHDWPGFGPQKNRALSYATGEWVLSLDADERVSDRLRDEIELVMREGAYQAYDIPRLSSYCGRFMRYSGWYPDYVTRLFRLGSAHFSDDLVHERLITNGAVGRLHENLLHYSFGNAEEVLRKMDQYSTAGAHKLYAVGKKSSLSKAVLRGAWSFFRTYVLRAGFLDGRKGFMLAVSNAEGTYYRYIKLMLMAESAGENSDVPQR